MKSLFEDSFSRVWHDGTSPIIFVRFTQIIDKKNFTLLGKITADFVKKIIRGNKNKNAYALVDLSDFTCACPKITEHFFHWLSELNDCGFAFTAIVIPREKSQSDYLINHEDGHVSLFSCFEKALRNINTQMTMRLLSQ